MFEVILMILLFIVLMINTALFVLKKRQKESYFHIKIKFAHNLKTKLVLNAKQYEQFKAFLNQSDGHFEIGDENDHVKIYREFICSVEVKRK